jgi:hypothetical protein
MKVDEGASNCRRREARPYVGEVWSRTAIPVFPESVTGKATTVREHSVSRPERGDSIWSVLLHGVWNWRTSGDRIR